MNVFEVLPTEFGTFNVKYLIKTICLITFNK